MTDTGTVTRWYVDAHQSGTDNHLTMECEADPRVSTLIHTLTALWTGEDTAGHAVRIVHDEAMDMTQVVHHRLGVIVSVYRKQVVPPIPAEPLF